MKSRVLTAVLLWAPQPQTAAFSQIGRAHAMSPFKCHFPYQGPLTLILKKSASSANRKVSMSDKNSPKARVWDCGEAELSHVLFRKYPASADLKHSMH